MGIYSNSKFLKHHEIVPSFLPALLLLAVPCLGTMTINVKTHFGETIPLCVEPSETIEAVKAKIEKYSDDNNLLGIRAVLTSGFPPECQLLFSGVLPDGWDETVVDGEPFYVNKSGQPWTSPDGTKVPHGEGTHTRPIQHLLLENEMTLAENNIENLADLTLDLDTACLPPMTIRVKHNGGPGENLDDVKISTLDVEPAEVAYVKETIRRHEWRESIPTGPTKNQHLHFDGKELEDKKHLYEYIRWDNQVLPIQEQVVLEVSYVYPRKGGVRRLADRFIRENIRCQQS